MNGVLLKTTDYTATNGTSVTLASGAAANDEVTIHTFGTFNAASTYSQSETNTLLAAKAPLATPTFTGGVIQVNNSGSAPSSIRLTCESNNSHYTELRAAPHAQMGGGNHTLTLPPNGGTSAGQVLITDGSGTMTWADAAAGGNTFQATANGSIADGKPVILENAGTVAQVAQTGTTISSVYQNNGGWIGSSASQTYSYGQMFYNPVENMVFAVYRDESNNYPTVAVGEISNTTANGITWGTPVILDSVASYWVAGGCQESHGRMIAFWQDNQLVEVYRLHTVRNVKCYVRLGIYLRLYSGTVQHLLL